MRTTLLLLAAFAVFLANPSLRAQLPYQQTFKSTTASGVVFSGNAKLTAASGVDPDGDGYLRLTDNTTNQVGYVYAKDAFPSNYGLTTTFEFFTYKSDGNGYNQADGICFFLFDASVNAFRPGGLGGSLGYAQYYSTSGMTKGYLGIGIDEYGNYSVASEGRSGGTLSTGPRNPSSVVIRGPGNGKTATDYPYIAHVQTNQAPYNISFLNFKQRYPDYTDPNYRRIKIILTPGSTLGTNKGFTITVTLYKGGTPQGTEVTLVSNYDYPYISPAKLQYGFAASTGANTDYHEIRNLNIVPTITNTLSTPSVANDAVSVCQGPKALLDVTANDASNNAGGTINKASVDLDPATAGIQNSFTDPGKGSYTVDQNGIVTFTAIPGFIGSSVINYTVSDNYGITSPNATITVTVSSILGPSLTMATPAGVCAPQVIDITNPTLRSNTTAGATYDYFSNLSDANNNTNSINSAANALSTSGTYYIRANSGVCYVVQPVPVVVSQIPTTASGGGVQNMCSPGNSAFTANDPLVGTGAWTQISGPTSAGITSPTFSYTSVVGLQQGTYTFRWTIGNGACANSSTDMVVKVANSAVAGSNQALSYSSTSTTLQANDPSPGTGAWTQVSGPTATIASPSNPQTAVSGLASGKSYGFKWTITNGCSTNSQMTVSVSGVLPVRFLSFTGQKQSEEVILNWQTASEKDNDHFVVERSTDGANFEAVGRVAGSGSSVSVKSYSYSDGIKGINKPALYYRLQQVDQDNQSSYSAVVKVDLTAVAQSVINTWPNPFTGSLHVDYSAAHAGTITVRLYDRVGGLVRQQRQAVTEGQNTVTIDHLEKISSGLYILEIEGEGEKQQHKIIHE